MTQLNKGQLCSSSDEFTRAALGPAICNVPVHEASHLRSKTLRCTFVLCTYSVSNAQQEVALVGPLICYPVK